MQKLIYMGDQSEGAKRYMGLHTQTHTLLMLFSSSHSLCLLSIQPFLHTGPDKGSVGRGAACLAEGFQGYYFVVHVLTGGTGASCRVRRKNHYLDLKEVHV